MAQESYQHLQGTDKSERQAEELMLQRKMENIQHKLLVLSGKGGVGKSTVAANLAASLASAGHSVGLLDIDVHGPSIPKLLGLEGRRIGAAGEEMSPVKLNDNLSVMSIGFLLQKRTDAVIWRGPRKHGAIRQFLKDVAWGQLDYLVVDSPPGTGDEPMSVAQLVGSRAGAVIVTTPQDLAISDVRRCVSFCNDLSIPVVGIVENMSGFVCPKCGERINLFKAGGGKALAAEMGVPFLGPIPVDPEIVSSGDAGTLLTGTNAETPSGKAFADVVRSILARQTGGDVTVESEGSQKETRGMKIAIPIAEGRLCAHFGHCEEFAILDVDEQNKDILNKSMLTPPTHEPGVLPRWLHEQGANVIIAGGMGQRAQQLFAQNDITVMVGAAAETPEQLASAYLNGALQTGGNTCDH